MRRDGTADRVSYPDILSDHATNPVVATDFQQRALNGACTELLCALTQTLIHIEDDEAYEEQIVDATWSSKDLAGRARPWEPCFDLFHDDHPFMQGGDRHEYGDPKPIEQLIAHLPAENDVRQGADWHYRRDPHHAIGAAEAAVQTYIFQAWTPLSLGQAARNGIRNTGPAVFLARGRTLWETLTLNMMHADEACTQESLPWMHDGLTTHTEQPSIEEHHPFYDALWYTPRIMRLERAEHITHYRMGPKRGERGNGGAHPWSPSLLKTVKKSGKTLSQYSARQARFVTPSFLGIAKYVLNAEGDYVFHALPSVSANIRTQADAFQGMWVFGYQTQNKVESWLDSKKTLTPVAGDLQKSVKDVLAVLDDFHDKASRHLTSIMSQSIQRDGTSRVELGKSDYDECRVVARNALDDEYSRIVGHATQGHAIDWDSERETLLQAIQAASKQVLDHTRSRQDWHRGMQHIAAATKQAALTPKNKRLNKALGA